MSGKKLVFVSNIFNHYQKPLADEFVKMYGNDYAFIAMEPFSKGGVSAGMYDMNQASCVLRSYESPEAEQEARMLIDESDCVIIGGMPVSVVSSRLAQGKLTFMQSERFFKGPLWKDAVRFMKYRRYSGGRVQAAYHHAKFYLLCASAFAAWDYSTCGLFRGKAYRWGYFPEARRYDDVDGLLSRKEKGSILWAGRLIDWKHPDFAVKLAENLRAQGKDFRVKIVGSGKMQDELAHMISAKNLGDCVEMAGSLPFEQVREEMEKAQIYLFTSDRGEGWGVVLNEAMNSGCAAVAGERTGAAPYLVNHGQNGLIFRDRSLGDLTEKVSALLDEPERISQLGRNAYRTIIDEWNAEVAAKRFVELAERLRVSDGSINLWDDGPCSVAPVI
ncbi:MAG: glycosyltransferase [Synergistaceae bacterium]|nr:glycosyltransferase [Synergistaceae bacterium]